MKLMHSGRRGGEEFMVPWDGCPSSPSCSERYNAWVSKPNVEERPNACPACEEAELAARFISAARKANP